MAIRGLTGHVRALREAKFKLGYLKKGEAFPSDTDIFVGKLADGITPKMIEAYGAKPIADAKEPGTLSFGRELRGMMKFEYDARDPDGRELVYESLNRMWGQSRIRCSGDGGDGGKFAGEAWVRDKRLADRLQRAGLLRAERSDGKGWHAACHGKDCPLWHEHATKEDKMPACHRETRMRFVLLHPTAMDPTRTLDQQDEDYLRQLGWVEIATGSWHGTVDTTSGLQTIRAETGGRTAFIPFTLRRQLRSITAPNGRIQKHTLVVHYDTDEVQIHGFGRPGSAQLRPAMRAQLTELARGEAAVAALGPAPFDDVADIQPQPAPAVRPWMTALAAGSTTWTASDRDEALDQAQAPYATTDEPDEHDPADALPVRQLDKDERNELKRLCGGVEDANGRFSGLERFHELMQASYQALGVPKRPDDGDMTVIPYAELPERLRRAFGFLTTAHAAWIKDQLRTEEGEG